MLLLWDHMSIVNIVCLNKTAIEGKLPKTLISHIIQKSQHG